MSKLDVSALENWLWEAAKNDFNLSPSRYVATDSEEEVLPLEEAVVQLRQAAEERTEADTELERVLNSLALEGGDRTEPRIEIPKDRIVDFCRRHNIRRLSLFGSALREDFRPGSDVDILVEFEPEAEVGFIAFSQMQRELSALLKRTVDLVPREGLKPAIRESVLTSAEELYAS